MDSDQAERLKFASNPRLAKPEDAAALSELLASAFSSDPVFDYMVREGTERPVVLRRLFHRLLSRRDIPQGEVWMSADGVACAAWLPPGARTGPSGLIEQWRAFRLFLGICGFARIGRGGALAAAMEKNHPAEPHFYLPFMAVEPRHQGTGLGSAILEATLARIDGAKAAAYLENSNPKNTRLYERAGFVAQKTISPAGAPPLVAMWRPKQNR